MKACCSGCSVPPGGARPLDRLHRLADGSGEGEAGQHAAATDMHRAGPALAMIATLLRPGQPELLAQRIEKRGTDIDRQPIGVAIDGELDRDRVARIAACRWRDRGIGQRAGGRQHCCDRGSGGEHPAPADARPGTQIR